MQILLYSKHFIWSISQRMQTRTLLNFKDLGTKRWRFNLQNDKLDKKIQKFYSCTVTRLSAVLQTGKKKIQEFYSCTETRLSAVLGNDLFEKETSADNNAFITNSNHVMS